MYDYLTTFIQNFYTMTEEFLHYIWRYRLFNQNLKLTTGDECQIIDVGSHNIDAGPDFFNAKIKFDNTIWVGNIEIHIKSSDWFTHKHQHDKAYDNIILHIVYDDDKPVRRKNGELIPTISLRDKFDKKLFETYNDFMTNRNWIPCNNMIKEVDRFVLNNWIDRLMVERLENKAVEIEEQLKFNGNNWEETFYQFLARNFGFKVNSTPFELLAKSLSLNYLGKHKNNKFQIEALLFGQAGLLSKKYEDEYPKKLQREYLFLQKKYMLIPIDPHLWRYMRMRPSNFPTIRLAQFADLVFNSSHLFSKILETDLLKDLCGYFELSVSKYWETHYSFDKKSKKTKKQIGKSTINLIVINTIIPFLFVFGRLRNNQAIIDKALKFLDQIPGESNSILNKWNELGMSVQTAYNTQALLELKNNYCNKKKCLSCGIGNVLLKNASSS